MKQYVMYLHRWYGMKVNIVFDGYDSASNTKDHEHLRRKEKTKSVLLGVAVQNSHTIVIEQEHFLANAVNKDRLIKLLVQAFEEA